LDILEVEAHTAGVIDIEPHAKTIDTDILNHARPVIVLHQSQARVSTIAADYLGLSDRRRLVPGAWADVVLLDRDLTVQQVLVEGEWI